MDAALVRKIYDELERRGVAIWIDGGWCVDALLGHQTRPHSDLDIAVETSSVPKLRSLLSEWGFSDFARPDSTSWMFVLSDAAGNKVDVHAMDIDAQGRGVLGPPELGHFYPAGALDGAGVVDGAPVRCVAPEVMVQFKMSFEQREIDRADVAALCERFGINALDPATGALLILPAWSCPRAMLARSRNDERAGGSLLRRSRLRDQPRTPDNRMVAVNVGKKTSSPLLLRNDGRPPQEGLPDDPEPSWQSRGFNTLLRLLPFKKRLASAAIVQERVRRLTSQPASHEPVRLGRGVEITKKIVAGWPVYYMASSANREVDAQVIFLHGGGYIQEIVPAQWRFIGYLTRYAPARCIVPIFPLAPRGTANEVVPATAELVRNLLDNAGPDNVTLIGNSSGAGLMLATVQRLRDSGFPQPKMMVLISPWLDASISRKEQEALAARDPMQAVPGLVAAGRLYAGDLDVAHPYVSPLNGDLRDLAPMMVFSGTRDLLYPDSIDLARKAERVGAPVELHLRKGQPHNYALLPTPEGREARALIARAVASRP